MKEEVLELECLESCDFDVRTIFQFQVLDAINPVRLWWRQELSRTGMCPFDLKGSSQGDLWQRARSDLHTRGSCI